MIRDYLGGLLLIALLLTCIAALWYRSNAATAQGERDAAVTAQQAAEVERDDIKGVLATERERATRMAEIAGQYEQDKTDAQGAADRMLADLRTDNRKLRTHWQAALATSELSRAVASASFADGGADLRQRDIAAVRGIVGRCEANVRGLQAVVEADRQ